MAVTIYDSRPASPESGLLRQNDSFFSWSWLLRPVDGRSKSAALDRVSSSSSSTSSSSEGLERASERSTASSPTENYSRSSSGSSTGFGFGKDYVPEKSEMKRVFEKFDENNDGKICGKDLHRFMGRLGMDMTLEEAKSMVTSVGHNTNGCVDFEEFYSLYLSLSGDDEATDEVEAEPEQDEEDDTLLQVFKVFDRNGDGLIAPQELQEVLTKLGIPEGKDISNCKQMIRRVDSNGDERIDITEFKSMMCSSYFLN